MLDVPISPNDPVFFLHHSFVDYMWEKFRQLKQSTKLEKETDYPDSTRSCTSFHYFNSTMTPFPLRNSDGLQTSYTDLFYSYQDRPVCTQNVGGENQCGSPYLICDRRRWRCLSKVQIHGNCTGFENSEEELCYNSKCLAGVCQPVDGIGFQKEKEFVGIGVTGSVM